MDMALWIGLELIYNSRKWIYLRKPSSQSFPQKITLKRFLPFLSLHCLLIYPPAGYTKYHVAKFVSYKECQSPMVPRDLDVT